MFDNNGLHDKLSKVPKMVLSKLLTLSSFLYSRLLTEVKHQPYTKHQKCSKLPANIHSK